MKKYLTLAFMDLHLSACSSNGLKEPLEEVVITSGDKGEVKLEETTLHMDIANCFIVNEGGDLTSPILMYMNLMNMLIV